ncbi:MAG: ribonuclease J [Alphaproteobacteria bacterium]|nr:ribonuclease J [Alphaproteobacteria bacterium]
MGAPFPELAFVPLGGTGEIGMNLNVYMAGESLLAVDCGIGFGGTERPEAEIMLPDPAWLVQRRAGLTGLVITHAHEDHVGAVAYLWPRLRCPVYATPFAAAVLRRKLAEAGLVNDVPLTLIPPGGAFGCGPFSLQFINVAHSTPEAQALAIRTPAGLIIHTGDWKLDPSPTLGPPTDEAALAELGRQGVLALVCDSTNAMVEGHSGSESDVRDEIASIIAQTRGRIVVTCFASNVARVESIARAARNARRSVVIAGRSLRNLEVAARDCGYLRGIPQFLPEESAEDIADDNLLLLVTGSQGEARSALSRIADDRHRNIALGEGDTVIFSSRVIPGNERAVAAVKDALVRRGVRLISDDEAHVHVSGHPAREELRTLYRLVRPRYAVPVHGEGRHLAAHAALAREEGAKPILLDDGDILRLAPGEPEVVDAAPVGRLVLDGTRLVPFDGAVMGARRRMLQGGLVIASLAVDARGRLRGMPVVSAPGVFDPESGETQRLAEALADELSELGPMGGDEDSLADAARAALRRGLARGEGRGAGRRPQVEVHLVRL